MTWLSTAWIAVALGMDALAVAMAATSAGYGDGPRSAFRLSFNFGLYQFLMPLIGWFLGTSVAVYIESTDHWIAFGLLTLSLHEELLRGEPAALGLAAFIGVFWTLRLLVDFFYFTQEDWPAGRGMVLGHVLLSTLFVALAATYLGLVAWHGATSGA